MKKMNFWGIGNIGEGVVSTVTSTYFMVYLTETAMLPLGLVSLISLIGSIFDFMMVPIAGTLMVSARTMRWGKYRSWLLLCPPFVVVFYLLCFTNFASSLALTAACALLGYIGGKIAWNIVYAANVSLTAVLSDSTKEKTKLTSQRMMGSNIGRLLGNSLTPAIVAAAAVHMSETNGYRVTILIMGTVYIVTSLLHFRISAGYSDAVPETSPEKEERLSVGEVFRVVIREPRLLLTLLIDMTSNIASLVLPTLAVYYYKYCVGAPKMVSTHMLIIGFGGLAGAALVRALGDRIRHTKPILITLYVGVAAALLSIRLFPTSIYYFMAIGAVISVLTGMTSPLELTLYIDTAAHYRHRTGQDATGFIMGLSNLPVKFAGIVKSTLIPFVLMLSGYVANADPTPAMQRAIVNAYTLVPAIFPAMGILLLGFVYKTCEQD